MQKHSKFEKSSEATTGLPAFRRLMRGLVVVSKEELAAEIAKHEAAKKRREKQRPKS